MDTRVFCVYNLARGVFLSSKVTVADSANQPLKILKVMVSGIAMDSESGLWLTPLNGMPWLPRVFPFDLVYLDEDYRVLDAAEVVPGVDFPLYRSEMASALVLPLHTVHSTQTGCSDRLIICLEQEMGSQLAAVESSAARRSEMAPTLPKHAVVLATMNGHTESFTAKAGSESIQGAKSSIPVETPGVSITEVVLERPRTERPHMAEVRGDVEDIFSNWVVSPAPAPQWVAQTVDPEVAPPNLDATDEPTTADAAKSSALATGDPGVSVKPEVEEASHQAETPPVVAKAAREPVPLPARIATTYPPQTTAFTITQSAMWRASEPTGGGGLVNASKAPFAKSAETAKSISPTEPATGSDAAVSVPQPRGIVAEARAFAQAQVQVPGKEGSQIEERAGIGKFTRAVEQAGVATRGSVAAATTPENTIPTAEHRETAGQVPLPKAQTERPAEGSVQNPAGEGEQREGDLPAGKTVTPALISEGAVQRKWMGAKTAAPARKPAAKEQVTKKEAASNSESKLSIALPASHFLKPEQKGKPRTSTQRVETDGKSAKQPASLGARFRRWLNPETPVNSDRRRAYRRYVPGMVAHYYTGGAPKPHDVADISMSGFYLLTEDRWMPDTMIEMTLQKPCAKGERKQSIHVLSRIVRRGSDGVAAEFVMPETLDPQSQDVQPSQTTDRFSLARFL